MVHDESLAHRYRIALRDRDGISEKRMMGGICFLLNGNMIGGANRTKDGARRFMFRVGKDQETEALARPGARVMEHGGRRMGGFIFVDAEACEGEAMDGWVALALHYVETLPPK